MTFQNPLCPTLVNVCNDADNPVLIDVQNYYLLLDQAAKVDTIVAGTTLPTSFNYAVTPPTPQPLVPIRIRILIEPPVNGVLNLTTWNPTGLVPGQEIEVQKVYAAGPSHSGYIWFNDQNGISYVANNSGDSIVIRYTGQSPRFDIVLGADPQ